MTVVYVCIIFTAIFAAGYYLLAHFNEFMRKSYKDSYGDGDEGKGLIVVSKKKKKGTDISDQFTFEAMTEEGKED